MSVTTLMYKINADTGDLGRELRFAERDVQRFQKRAESNISKLGKAFGAMGAVAATALLAITKEGMELAAEMDEVSRELGISTEEVSALKHAAEETDVEFGTFTSRMERFNRQIAEAAGGTGDLKDTFRDYGIELRDNQDQVRSQTDLLLDIADAMEGASDHTERLDIATAAFGNRGGAEMIKMLEDGSDSVEGFMEAAEEAGLVIESELGQKAQQVQANQRALRNSVRSLGITLASQTVPQVAAYSSALAENAQEASNAASETSVMERAVTRTLGSVEIMRSGFVVLGQTLGMIGAQIAQFTVSSLDFIRQLAIGTMELLENATSSANATARALAAAMTDPLNAREHIEQARAELSSGYSGIISDRNRMQSDLDDIDEEYQEKASAIWEGYKDDVQDQMAESHSTILSIQNAQSQTAEEVEKSFDNQSDATRHMAETTDDAASEMERLIDIQQDFADRREAHDRGISVAELRQLRRLKEIREERLISAEEFAWQKDQIIGGTEEIAEETDDLARIEEQFADQRRAADRELSVSQLRQIDQLDELREAGRLTFSEYEWHIDQIVDTTEEASDELSRMERLGAQAARNVGDSLQRFIVDPFGASFSSMIDSALQDLTRLAVRMAITDVAGSSIPGFATGGAVSGPGTATSDSILARLSDGEYVIDAKTTGYYGADYFAAHQSRNVPRFATGGPVGSAPSGGGSPQQSPINIAIFDDRDDMRQWLQSREGRKIVVDHVQQSGAI